MDLKPWDGWNDNWEKVYLNSGSNSIKLQYDQNEGDTGNINIDYIAIPQSTCSEPYNPTPASEGYLEVSSDMPPTNVNLSTEGTYDWAHWGYNGAEKFNHKALAGAEERYVGRTSFNGGGDDSQFSDSAVRFSWTDGTPDSTVTDTQHVCMSAVETRDGSSLLKPEPLPGPT